MKIFIRLAVLLGVLILAACGGSQDGATTDTTVTGATLTLSSSLSDGELLARRGQLTIYADVTNEEGGSVADGTAVYFIASSGSITRQASSVNGRAEATFTAPSVSGNVAVYAGTEAVYDADNVTLINVAGVVDEYHLTVASGPAAQIEIVSITPEHLALRGTGEGEVGTFVFNVTDGSGGPVQDGQLVSFTLDAPTGGAEFVSDSSATTIGGEVSVSLVSGNVAGVATVTASTVSELGTITTKARITIGNSRPDQLHLGMAAERLNIPGLVRFGIENTVTAYIADRYSNPVPAGTPVYFAGECGIVSLTDVDGVVTNFTNQFGEATATTVTAQPTSDLCRYIYWTEGEEAYTDSNGNGMYDLGEPHTDVTEPFIDSDDDGVHDSNELYFDLDQNGYFTTADGIWQGDTFVWTSMNVRWSGFAGAPQVEPASFSLSQGESQTFMFTATDIDGNPMPSGTTVSAYPEADTCEEVTFSGAVVDGVILPDAVNNQSVFSLTVYTSDSSTVGPCNITFEVTGADEDGNGTASTTVMGSILSSGSSE